MMPTSPIATQLQVLALAAAHLPHKILQVGVSPPQAIGQLQTYPINILDTSGRIVEPSRMAVTQKPDGTLELQFVDLGNH